MSQRETAERERDSCFNMYLSEAVKALPVLLMHVSDWVKEVLYKARTSGGLMVDSDPGGCWLENNILSKHNDECQL